MLKLAEEQKRLFYSSGYSKAWILKFPDIGFVINNDTLHSETVTLKETICDEEDFTLGGCIASSIEYEVSEIIASQISGLEFTAELAVRDGEGSTVLSVPMGTFRVDSAERVDDKDYKRVTAYDRMYDASVDVSEWYKEYFAGSAKHTVKETRESLLSFLGIPLAVQELPNDGVMLQKTTDPAKGSLPGTDVLRALCTINAGFGHMNRKGQFEVIKAGFAPLFPEETLYPEEDLYPEDTFAYLGTSDSEHDAPEYRTTNYEDYTVQKITCLYIQTESELAQIGSGTGNPYIISGNFLLADKTAAELQSIGGNIFNQIKDVVYRPNTTELTGLPYMEAGDVFALTKRTDTIESYIFSRTLTGIQALKDTYEAKGNEIRANELSVGEKVDQLQGKTDAIEESVEDVESDVELIAEDVSELTEQTTVRFETLSDSIEAEVTRATAEEGNLSTRISVTADGLSTEASRAKSEEESLSARISITADGLSTEVSRATSAENSLSSRLAVTAGEISAEVSRAQSTENSLSSRISVAVDEISTKVSKGDVVSEINQSSDTIYMGAGQLVIESGNFRLDSSGNATFSGTLDGAGGSFSGDLTSPTVRFTGMMSTGGNIYMYDTGGGVISCDKLNANDYISTAVAYTGSVSTNGRLSLDGGTGIEIPYLPTPSGTHTANLYRHTNGIVYDLVSTSSSRRYKNSISDIYEPSLEPERLYHLPVRQYKYNTDFLNNPANPQYDTLLPGFIAEEVAEIYPSAACIDEDGTIESWDPRFIVPPMLALIQRQKKQMDDMSFRLEIMQMQLNNLQGGN